MDTPDRTGDPRRDLKSSDDTVKVLAAQEAARRRDPSLIPQLIDLLSDDELYVRLNAHMALGVLSNQKQFGYFYLDPAKKRAEAIRRYREWFEATGGVDPPAGTAGTAPPTP